MHLIRPVACLLLLLSFLSAPVEAESQDRTPGSARIDAVLTEIADPGFIDRMVTQMEAPSALHLPLTAHLATIRTNPLFVEYMAEAIATFQAELSDETGVLSIDPVHDYAIETAEMLFHHGLPHLPPADIRDYLTLAVDLLRQAGTDDCVALIGESLNAEAAREIELRLLATLPTRRIDRYFALLTAGVIASLTPPAVPALTAGEMAFAERAITAALQAAITKHPDATRLGMALMTLENPSTDYHCEITIMLYEEILRMEGDAGDLAARLVAWGLMMM